MTDATILWAVTIVSAVVVLYLFWSRRQDHEQWERKSDHQGLVLEIQRELLRHHKDMLSRCMELQRTLDHQHRILKYVARRLS